MTAKVVDASALAALLFGEAEGAAVVERLRGADLIAPALLPSRSPTPASRRCVASPISETL
jgi:predicted nucleic acid-binding protein